MAADVGQPGPGTTAERMAGGDEGDDRLADDRRSGQAGRRGTGGGDEREIGTAVAHPLDQAVRVVLEQLDLDARVGPVERRERIEERLAELPLELADLGADPRPTRRDDG